MSSGLANLGYPHRLFHPECCISRRQRGPQHTLVRLGKTMAKAWETPRPKTARPFFGGSTLGSKILRSIVWRELTIRSDHLSGATSTSPSNASKALPCKNNCFEHCNLLCIVLFHQLLSCSVCSGGRFGFAWSVMIINYREVGFQYICRIGESDSMGGNEALYLG